MEHHTPHILVVDDEAPIRMTLDQMLQFCGYTVVVASSGEEALPLLEQHSFDLLLLDLRLPGISGLDIARHARTIQPTAAVMLLTGHAALEDTRDATDLDTFEVMLKTSSPEDVMDRVEAILKQQANAKIS